MAVYPARAGTGAAAYYKLPRAEETPISRVTFFGTCLYNYIIAVELEGLFGKILISLRYACMDNCNACNNNVLIGLGLLRRAAWS